MGLIIEMKQQIDSPEGMGLKDIVKQALETYGTPFKLEDEYEGHSPIVLCLLLDLHW